MPIIENVMQRGEARRAGDATLIPINQALKVQLPGTHIGMVWNRPRAVIVRSDDGTEQALPVTDVTRVVMWRMLAGGIIGAVVMGIRAKHSKRNPVELRIR